jgi:H+-transporting ATPase
MFTHVNNMHAIAPQISAWPTDALSTDEYTALQKYISTYRDPKAVDSEANQAKDAEDAKKGKAWWQVRRRPKSPHAAAPAD